MKRAIVLLLALLPGIALANIAAGTPRFTWQAPPLDQNGNPIPATGTGAITAYELYCDGDNVAPKRTFAPTIFVWQAAVTAFSPGLHSCYMLARNAIGVSLGRGVEVSFTLPPPPPPPAVAPGDVLDLKVI